MHMNDTIIIIHHVGLQLLPSTSINKKHKGVGDSNRPGFIQAADLRRTKLLIVQKQQCMELFCYGYEM